jgi:hypothetical protein
MVLYCPTVQALLTGTTTTAFSKLLSEPGLLLVTMLH